MNCFSGKIYWKTINKNIVISINKKLILYKSILHMYISMQHVLILFITILAIIFFQKIFLWYKVYDSVNDRSSHKVLATRSGGISIFTTLFLISFFNYLIGNEIFDFSLIVPLSLLVFLGLYDDIYKLDFKLKFIFQIIAAKIIIDNGLIIDNLHGVLGIFELNRVIGQFLTIFIIVAIINSINFIDGIDGLASSIILLFIIMFEFFSTSTSPFINLSLIIIFSIIPFFYFNFRRNKKVFLGDSGSLFLGGIVSTYVIFILSQEYIIKSEFDVHKILFVLSVLIYPIIDIIRITTKRIMQKKSPFKADKNHIHHIILSKTKSHFKTTFAITTFSILFLILIQILF